MSNRKAKQALKAMDYKQMLISALSMGAIDTRTGWRSLAVDGTYTLRAHPEKPEVQVAISYDDSTLFSVFEHCIVFIVDPSVFMSRHTSGAFTKNMNAALPFAIVRRQSLLYYEIQGKTYAYRDGLSVQLPTLIPQYVIAEEDKSWTPDREVDAAYTKDKESFSIAAKALLRLGVVPKLQKMLHAVYPGEVVAAVSAQMREGKGPTPGLVSWILSCVGADDTMHEAKVGLFFTIHNKKLRECYGVFGEERICKPREGK